MTELRTARVLLRRWRPEDETPLAAIDRDPDVARYLNRPTAEAATAAFHASLVEHWERHGFGPFASLRAPSGVGATVSGCTPSRRSSRSPSRSR